jgi:hypothetical protein
MPALNHFMLRGPIPPQVHGVLDYPLAAVLIAGARAQLRRPRGDGDRARLRRRRRGTRRGTAWSTGIVRVIRPLLHGYADVAVTAAMIVLPFAVDFTSHTTALVFYLVVGAGGLLATLATRFESPMPAKHVMRVQEAA